MTTQRVSMTALLALTMLAGPARWAAAHPGHAHTIMGTITMAHEGLVEVLDSNNEKTAFKITKATRILVGRVAGTEKDLKAGSRIVVEAEEEEGETFIAVKIQLPAATK